MKRRAHNGTYLPIVLPEMFGPDHERLLLFIEEICVERRGYPDVRRLSCNQARHPERLTSVTPDWRDVYSTKLRDGTAVPGHDDWDSIEDLVAAGLVGWYGTGEHPRFELTDAGWARAHELRRLRAIRALRS